MANSSAHHDGNGGGVTNGDDPSNANNHGGYSDGGEEANDANSHGEYEGGGDSLKNSHSQGDRAAGGHSAASAASAHSAASAASEKEIILTPDGLKKLETELGYLRGEKRREVAERMKQAKSFGDLSENSEYDEARLEQAHVEQRILMLEGTLRNARIIDEDDVTTEVVNIGCKVRILDIAEGLESEFHIVGSTEAAPTAKKLSNESPVGRALIGHAVGETVDVQAPDGVIRYKVLEISK